MATPDPRSRLRSWLTQIMETRHWKPADAARHAGVAPSTIGRALDPSSKFVMSTATIARIANAARIAPPSDMLPDATGFAAREAEPWAGPIDGALTQADNLDNWQIKCRALDLAGILPGDIVQVLRTAVPRADDVVLAQIYDLQGGPETVLRLYDPPYLVTRSSDARAHRKPALVDNERVAIVGVLHKLVRRRAD